MFALLRTAVNSRGVRNTGSDIIFITILLAAMEGIRGRLAVLSIQSTKLRQNQYCVPRNPEIRPRLSGNIFTATFASTIIRSSCFPTPPWKTCSPSQRLEGKRKTATEHPGGSRLELCRQGAALIERAVTPAISPRNIAGASRQRHGVMAL